MHGRIKWALICLLIAVSAAACTTVRYRKMVGIEFSNDGLDTIQGIKVTSGNCMWPMLPIGPTLEHGGRGITLYCQPYQELKVHWETAKGEHREINAPIRAPIQHSVIGWQVKFTQDSVTVWQLEEADRMLPRIVKQIYP